jgi:hypothetical protein
MNILCVRACVRVCACVFPCFGMIDVAMVMGEKTLSQLGMKPWCVRSGDVQALSVKHYTKHSIGL